METHQNYYLGYANVAFIDILGISAALEQSWGTESDTALQRFLRVKNAYPGVKTNPKTMFQIVDKEINKTDEIIYSQVRTLSDSVVVFSSLPPSPRDLTVQSFTIRVFDVLVCVGHIWQAAINEGFTIRGGIETGQMFWNNEDFTGPGLIKAYRLESKIASSSRILIGPDLLSDLVNAFHANPKIDNPINTLIKCDDGITMVNPKFLLKPENKKQLIQIQSRAGSKSNKYTELIERLEIDGEMPGLDEIRKSIQTMYLKLKEQ